jgi:hypothetical protein
VRCLALAILFSALACSSRPAPEAVPGLYFAAVEARDCAALERLTTGTLARDLRKFGCQDTIQKMKAHGIKLVATRGRKPDGRDPQAQLVTIEILFRNQPRSFPVRVQNVGGAWKLATM